MIVVVATVRAKEGLEADLRTLLVGLVPVTREEHGCIQYDLHVAEDDPASFLFYERWTDVDALQAHLSSPHIGAAFAAAAELCDGVPTIVRYQHIA